MHQSKWEVWSIQSAIKEYALLTVHSNPWYHSMQHTSWTHLLWLIQFICCSHTQCLSALERVQILLNDKSIFKIVFFHHIEALRASALKKPHSQEASLLSCKADERQVTAILAFTFLHRTFNCSTQFQIRNNYNSSIQQLNTRKLFLPTTCWLRSMQRCAMKTHTMYTNKHASKI